MGVMDALASLGEIQLFISQNAEALQGLAKTLPATLDTWSRAIVETRDGVARLETGQRRILALLDPQAITQEITAEAAAWAPNDPRNALNEEGV
jgi:hypothetical protein